MNEKVVKELIAQSLQAQAEALALVVAAMSRQMDAEHLAEHLRAQLYAAKQTGSVSAWGLKQTSLALVAVEAEINLRKMDGNPIAH